MKIKQKKREETHLNKTKFYRKQMETNERSKHRSQTKKCNSISVSGVCVCVSVFGVISKTFHFLHCYFSLFCFFVLSSVIPEVKTSADELHKHRTYKSEETIRKKRNHRQKEAICCCVFHLRLRFIVFKYSKIGRWLRTKRGVSSGLHDALQAVASR